MSVQNAIRHIEPLELKKRIEKGDALVLLDVREEDEIEVCALPNITHIPTGEIVARIHELNPEDEIICICHVGQRAYYVAQYLQESGFKNVSLLQGGMVSYAQQADPSLSIY